MHILLMGMAVSLPHFYLYLNISNHFHNKIKQKIHKNRCISQNQHLQSTIPEVELNLCKVKHKFQFLSETGLSLSIPMQEFTILGYSSLTVEQNLQNWYGLGTYIKDGLPCDRGHKNEDSHFPLMCFGMTLIHSISFIFTVIYRMV